LHFISFIIDLVPVINCCPGNLKGNIHYTTNLLSILKQRPKNPYRGKRYKYVCLMHAGTGTELAKHAS